MSVPTCPTRSVRWLLRPELPGESSVIRIAVGAEGAEYLLTLLSDGALELRKIAAKPERYVVRPAGGWCSCGGFRWRRRCKHLDALRRLMGTPIPNAVRVEDLDADQRAEIEERSAIMEYDGGLPRERAEALALTEISRMMGAR